MAVRSVQISDDSLIKAVLAPTQLALDICHEFCISIQRDGIKSPFAKAAALQAGPTLSQKGTRAAFVAPVTESRCGTNNLLRDLQRAVQSGLPVL